MTRNFKEKIYLLQGQAPVKYKRDEGNGTSQKCIVTIDLDASVGQSVLDMSYPAPHEGA